MTMQQLFQCVSQWGVLVQKATANYYVKTFTVNGCFNEAQQMQTIIATWVYLHEIGGRQAYLEAQCHWNCTVQNSI